MRGIGWLFGAFCVVAGCTDRAVPDAGEPDVGASGLDAPDVREDDAGRDAGPDVGRDAGTDVGRDAGTDVGRDAGTDSGTFDAAACTPWCDPLTGSYYECAGETLRCTCGPCAGDPLACC